MTYVRRLRVVGAFLALVAVITTSHLWGESARQSGKHQTGPRTYTPDRADEGFTDDLADSKFAKGGIVSYRTSDGELLFADQIKLKLDTDPNRPRDLAIVVDTSASQAGAPLTSAQAITEAAIRAARPQDRVSVWTINTPAATRSLTNGFQPAGTKELNEGLEALKQEVPLGDTDLKEGLNKIAASFAGAGDREQVVLFLGDGMSVHNPITTADRSRLCENMVKHAIVFVSVPLGDRLDPKNLHGIATATGGSVVRLLPGEKMPDTLKHIQDALATPVFYPREFRFSADVAEFYPTVLPPLRGDAPTLVIGRLKGGDKLSYTLEGTVAGKELRFAPTEAIGESEPDNFFLISMVEQWKNARDQPALTRADRALASYFQQTQLARGDLISEAEWALSQDKLEAARDLFQKAKRLDPQDSEVDAGLKLVEKIRGGSLNKQRLKEQLGKKAAAGYRIFGSSSNKQRLTEQLAQAEKDDGNLKLAQAGGNAPPEIAPPAEREDLLQLQKARAQVEQQRVTSMVEDAQREARRLLSTDPDLAQDILKRTLAAVRDNPDLGEGTRQLLSNRLETGLRSVATQGVRIKEDLAQRLKELADARRHLDLEQSAAAEADRTHRRMLVFTNLMAQARYEDAYLQSLAVQQDAINTGRPVPVAATAGYDVALAANNLTQIQELNRVRQERFLLTMMQVERSHIPFPDEPPIQFAPAQVWREITKLRKEKYESSGFTDDDPATMQSIRRIKEKLSKPVSLDKGIDKNTPLKDALEFLSDRYDVTILVDSAAFKADNVSDNVEDTPVSLPRMSNVSLGTILRLLAGQINGTYLVRRDYIEFTTGTRAVTEKVIRVYPVADLVIPIPNAFNQSQVQNALSIFGTAPGLGLNVGGPQALGGFQFGGALVGGGLGGIGLGGGLGGLGLGGGLGGLGLGGGGLGLGGGGLGLGGGGLGLGGGGGGLGFGGGGQVNLGAGGGQLGVGGGQLGQFGNLGGQFGLQGGDQSLILVELIRQVVGNPKEWQARGFFQRPPAGGFNPAAAQQPGGPDDGDDLLPADQLNSLGYYPPARALVVKGTSRIHTNVGGGLLGTKGGGGMGFLDKDGKDDKGRVAFIPGQNRRRHKPADEKSDEKLAANQRPQNSDTNKANVDPGSGEKLAAADLTKDWLKAMADGEIKDPKKAYEEALAKGVKDPGVIIACADFLAERKFYYHLAEFLKANLRQGIVVRPWVYEALALALEECNDKNQNRDDIERARLSAIDLEPQDARSYVTASRAMAQLNRYDRAVAFCRQASLLEPNAPAAYEEALLMADLSKDSQAMQWAAGGLLRRDWPVGNDELHQKANAKVQDLIKRLKADNRSTEAERLTQALAPYGERDMVINLSWQGDADLDLEVVEPIQSKCSFMQRQTPGGGILIGDTMEDMSHESYVLAQGFPGEYQVTIRKIWGRPLGGKATVEIIQHQGTSQVSRRRETIVFDRSHSMTVVLDGGRRTTAAYVPTPTANERKRTRPEVATSDQVLHKLRSLANPDLSGTDTRMRGGLSSLGLQLPPNQRAALQDALGEVVYQTKVPSMGGTGVDLTAQATIGADKSVTLKFTPVFQSVSKSPAVSNPLIPGGADNTGGD